MAKVTAVVLAAGLSTRMEGGKKLFLPYGSSTIIGEVLHQLSKSIVDEIVVVGNTSSVEELQEVILHEAADSLLISNEYYKLGMTTSIQAGISAAHAGSRGYMICLADMPKIQSSTYNEIITAFKKHYQRNSKTIVLPVFEGKKGNPAVFSGYYKQQILDHKDMEGCKGVIQDNSKFAVNFEVNSDTIFIDIDNRENYLNYKI